MSLSQPHPAVGVAPRLAIPILLLLAACADPAPVTGPPDDLPGASPAPAAVVALVCDGSARGVVCAPSEPSLPAGVAGDRILGGQGTYVRLTQTSSTFLSSSNQLIAQVALQNLTDQAMGTTDGTTKAPNPVRVFFHTPPTNGVQVQNAGTGSFTGTDQKFYLYDGVILANQSRSMQWVFILPTASTTFTFTVYVSARFPNETGPVVGRPAGGAAFSGIFLGSKSPASCAVRTGSGVPYCWGPTGTIGDGATASDPPYRTTPSGLVGNLRMTALAPSSGFNCALVSAVGYCWGNGGSGQLGDGASSDAARYTPAPVAMPAGVTFTAIATGFLHACAVGSDGGAYCWGNSTRGAIGDGPPAPRPTPTRVSQPAAVERFQSISLGDDFSCAIAQVGPDDTAAYCWGYNGLGQLGDGTATNRHTPTAVAAPAGVRFTQVTAGGFAHACALSSSRIAYCWGSGNLIGDGTTTARRTPTPVAMPAGVTFTQIAAGDSFTCALATGGDIYCWGANGLGSLGDGTTTHSTSPVRVAMPAGVTFAAIAAGQTHACALTPVGAAYCWGNNNSGRLGDGTTTTRLVPTPVSMP